jgi:ABC-type uncharacterized transport system involved in gliding motility auxiliary subunit
MEIMANKQKNSTGDSRRYAVIGLWISVIAFIALLVAAAMKVFQTTGFYTPSNLTLIPRLFWGSMAGILIGLSVFAIFDPNRVRAFLTGRQAKYGSNALITSVAFLAILVFANVIAYLNPIPLDLTTDKKNTLAPETIDAFGRLPQPVTATAFFSSQLNPATARDLLEKYRMNSNGKFEYTFVDPDKNPLSAQQAGVTGDGKILLKMGANHEIVSTASESEITNGLIKLLNPEKLSVYFITGEGEHSTEEAGDTSYTRIRQALESKNYVVKTINLEAESIPSDAKVLVLAGPTTPLSDQAVQSLKAYLAAGGSLIALENPVPLTNFGDKKDPLADYLASDWGISLNNDIVIDTQSPSSAYNAIAVKYNKHPITEKMSGVGVTFPFARSLSISQNIQNVTVSDLIYTTPASWGEKDFSSIQANKPSYDPNTEQAGPMLLAAAAENTATKGRVVVMGNSAFAVDSNFDYSGNGDLLVNSIDWGAQKENLISLTSASPTERKFVAPGAFQQMVMLAGSVCLIPLAIILMGAASWYTRRKQG